MQQQQYQQQQTSQKFATIAKPQSRSISASIDPTDLSFETSTPISEKMIFDTPKRESTVYETPSPSNISSSTLASNISDKSLVKSILDKHIAGLKTKPSQYDTVYGVRNGKFQNSKKTYVGNLEVRFKNGNITFYDIQSKNVAVFEGTPKLYNLLFLKNPSVVDDKDQLNENVMQNYKQILELTDAPYNYKIKTED